MKKYMLKFFQNQSELPLLSHDELEIKYRVKINLVIAGEEER